MSSLSWYHNGGQVTARNESQELPSKPPSKNRDFWDKMQIGSTALAALLVPVALGVFGHLVNASIKNKELELRLMELAVDLLKTDPVVTNQPGVRNWSIDVLEKHSGVEFDEVARIEIRNGPLITLDTVDSLRYSGRADSDLRLLHPVFRHRLRDLLLRLSSEGHNFKVIQTYRSPSQQVELYACGRDNSRLPFRTHSGFEGNCEGPSRTNAWAWHSALQYGMAAHLVLVFEGDPELRAGPEDVELSGLRRLAELASEYDIAPGPVRPYPDKFMHVKLNDVRIEDLMAGRYPDGGDRSWSENLTVSILEWDGEPDPPPIPSTTSYR